MGVRHDAEQVSPAFCGNEHVAIRWGFDHQHDESSTVQERCLQVGELRREDGLAARACHHPPAAGQSRREVHLVAKQAYSLERGDRFCAMRTLYGRFQSIDRIVPFRLGHS